MRSELLSQWHATRNGALTPDKVSPGSNRNVWWVCPRGHEYQALVKDRVRRGSGCPYCAGRKALAGFNDLATFYPDVAAQWHPNRNGDLTPQMVTPGSHKVVWWQCAEGHEWQTEVKFRADGTGCPECARRAKKPYEDDLATTHPHLVPQWHPTLNNSLTPSDIVAGSKKHVWWLCDLGHQWTASVVARAIRGEGCPVCAGKVILPGFNDLATHSPDIAAQWHPTLNEPMTPDSVSPYTSRKVWWQCEHGHEWQASVAHRVRLLSGCPVCAGTIKP